MPKFICNLDGKIIEYDLADGTYIVGRGSSCDIIVKSPIVSSQHMRLDVKNGSVAFRDLLSRNGIFLNGDKALVGEIKPGDSLRMGKVEVKLDFGGADEFEMTPAVSPVSAGVPMDFMSNVDDDAGDVTPPDIGFAPPAVVERASPGAVEVVHPGDNLPATIGTGGGAFDGASPDKKKKVILAIAAALIVLSVGLAMIDTTPVERTGVGDSNKVDYWSDLSSGIKAFGEGNYEKARAVWDKADADLKMHNKELYPKRPSARIFSTVVNSLIQVRNSQGEPVDVNWLKLYEEVVALRNRSSLSAEVDQFALSLSETITEYGDQAEQYRKAQEVYARGDFAEAKEKLAEIPAGSLYHKFIDGKIETCDKRMDEDKRKFALQSYGSGNRANSIRDGIAKLREIPVDRRTTEDKNNIRKWEKDAKYIDLCSQIIHLAGSEDRNDKLRADGLVDTVLREFPGRTQNQILEDLKREIGDWVYIDDLSKAFDAWDTGKIEKMKKERRANLHAAKQIFEKADNAQKWLSEGKVAIEKKQYEKAKTLLEQVRRAIPVMGHPVNDAAKAAMLEISPAKLAREFFENAQAFVKAEKYRKARRALERAAAEAAAAPDEAGLGEEISGEAERIKKLGKRLFSKAVMDYSNNMTMASLVNMEKAIECYLPGEDKYDIYVERYKKNFRKNPPDFDKKP